MRFSLYINNSNEPKVLVVGNNPDRQNIYSVALGLYNSRIVKLINKKKQLKSSVIIGELPTTIIAEFTNDDGSDNLKETIEANYKRVKREVISLIDLEIERIKANPTLCNLIKE